FSRGNAVNPGLDDVVVAETVLSHVDGAGGRLIVRGHELEDVAGLSCEAVLALLWNGLPPQPPWAEEDVRTALGAARLVALERVAPVIAATDQLSAVEALRLCLASLADADTTPHHVLAAAAVPVFVAAIARRRAGQASIAPDPTSGQAADFLRMMRETTPPPPICARWKPISAPLPALGSTPRPSRRASSPPRARDCCRPSSAHCVP